jgi:hypothetical protein
LAVLHSSIMSDLKMSDLKDTQEDSLRKGVEVIEVETPEHAEFVELDATYQGEKLGKLLVGVSHCAALTHAAQS